MTLRATGLLVVSALALAGCATPPTPTASADRAWHPVALPGKAPTRYRAEAKEGRPAIRADADASASLWRRQLDLAPDRLGGLRWSWWIDGAIPGADLTDADRSDSPARIVLAFDGDRTRLPQRTRLMFDLARAITGEEPPYATLMYVWSADLPVGTVVRSQRSDRIRKIVVDSGPGSLRRWRDHERDIVADFEKAFGESPGRLVGVAKMTDADNTRSRARAWYGAIELGPDAGP